MLVVEEFLTQYTNDFSEFCLYGLVGDVLNAWEFEYFVDPEKLFDLLSCA